MLGLRMIGMARIKFDAVDIMPTNLIGKRNQGLRQADQVIAEICLLLSALAFGTAQGSYDRLLAHIKDLKQFECNISPFQASRYKMADMIPKIEQARYLTCRAAPQLDRNKANPTIEG